MTEIPKSHPRYASLVARERVAAGVKEGITSVQGLIAQGRGEAFDYLIGELTLPSALKATRTAAALLLLAERPALSVNGNVAALASREMVDLAAALNIPLEVNLFHRTEERVRLIADRLRSQGASEVLGEKTDVLIAGLDHSRARATRGGIFDADVVLIPLEDGDRCEALVAMGKKVIAIDLNPLSRTARKASVSIVDNIVRAVPNLIQAVRDLRGLERSELERMVREYDNKETLQAVGEEMQSYLAEQFSALDS
ncbi:MAG: phosphopantothenate/pantothenate synthetase [Methanosarcinales archaeon]|nr:phosphopantothenate/pantothenate synthetase [Methanosarcinales archaeon]